MTYRFDEAVPVLRRTPAVLRTSLEDLPPAWTEYLSILCDRAK